MTRADFIIFLEKLKAEYEMDNNGWENVTVSDYLEAMARYADDIQGFYDNTGQKIDADKADWKTFADIMKGATIYE